MRVLIIGASFAGVSCALRVKRLRPEFEVVVLDQATLIGYMPNGLNWYYQHKIQHLEEAVYLSREALEEADIAVGLGEKLLAIEPISKEIVVERGGGQIRYAYDYLVLAMGSRQESTYIEAGNLSRVLTLKDYEASRAAQQVLDQAGHVTVVGGGVIGLEASQTYSKLGKQVTLLESTDSLDFKNTDQDMLAPLLDRMEKAGVEVGLSQRVESIRETKTGRLEVVTNQRIIETDAVVLGVNFRPNSQLLEGLIDLHLDKTVKVDTYMQTSLTSVYAVGDLIQLPTANGQSHYLPLVGNAIRTGEIAASHIAGSPESLPPLVKLLGSHHFGLYRASVGLTQEEAELYEDCQVTYYSSLLSPLNPEELTIKLIVSQETGKILGGQFLSVVDCLGLANWLALAISQGMSDGELARQEFIWSVGDASIYGHLHSALLQSFEMRDDGC